MTRLICLDTNVWYAECLLRSAAGAALIYAVQTNQFKLLLPEIVERELVELVARKCQELLDGIGESKRRLKNLTGKRVGTDLPVSERAISQSVLDRIAQLNSVVVKEPTPESAYRLAFDRVVECRVPNSEKNQQAKDSLLWESLVALEAGTELILVTSDVAFYEERSVKAGLSKALSSEAKARDLTVTLVEDCLKALSALTPQAPNVDCDAVRALLEVRTEEIARMAWKKVAHRDFEISGLIDTDLKLAFYLTSDTNEIAVVFTLRTKLAIGNDGETEELVASGTCKYLVASSELSELQISTASGTRSGIQMMTIGGGDEILGVEFGATKAIPALRIPLELVEAALARR